MNQFYYSDKTKLFYVLQADGNFVAVNLGGTYRGRINAQDIHDSFGQNLEKLRPVTPDQIESIAPGHSGEILKVGNTGHAPVSKTPDSTTSDSNLGGGTSTSSVGVNAGRTAVTLGNGQTVYYDAQGNAYSESGTPVTSSTIAKATSDSAPIAELGTGAPVAQNSPQADQTVKMTDQQFQDWLKTQNLTPDQKSAIEQYYGIISTNDTATATRLLDAFNAAYEYSDPYFKAQIRLVADSLKRSLEGKDGDLAYQVKQEQDALTALQQDVAASKDYLSFQNRQDLAKLERDYKTNLETKQADLAATGFTSSSVRNKAEQLLGADYTGAVESSNRGLAYQTGGLDRNLAAKTTSTADDIQRLKDLAAAGKLDLTRNAESQIGSTGLAALGYDNLLGGVGGSIPQAQYQDALSAASNFVF